jgi:predicted phosphoribosyltransferase
MFNSRNEVGRLLAQRIKEEVGNHSLLTASLLKGGVVVGAVVSSLLDTPHTPILVEEIFYPKDKLVLGAVSQNPKSLILRKKLVKKLKISIQKQKAYIYLAQQRIEREKEALLNNKKQQSFKDKTVIICDDGSAGKLKLLSAIKEARLQNPQKIIVAIPVAAPKTIRALTPRADEVIVLKQPQLFFSASQFYQDFPEVTLEEAGHLLGIKEVEDRPDPKRL